MKMTDHNGIGKLLIVVVLLLSGCAPTPHPEVSEPQSAVLAEDLVGSKWHLTYHNPRFGQREYHLIFRMNGRLLNTHPNEKTPDNDRWEQSGKKVVLRFNDGFAIYKGELYDNGKYMTGTATSKSGGEWEWTANRIDE